MKTQLTTKLLGKWYQIASSRDFRKRKFVDILVFFEECPDFMNLFFVGTQLNRKKTIKDISFKIVTKGDSSYLCLKRFGFRNCYKIVILEDDVLIVSNRKMRYLSVFSKAPTMEPRVLESYLKKIDFNGLKKIDLLYY